MAKKQEIKQSEARILFYLSVVHPTRKYVQAISDKLELNYAYLLNILNSMYAKGWLTKHSHKRYMFYSLTPKAPLEQAKTLYLAGDLQADLSSHLTAEVKEKPLKQAIIESNGGSDDS